MTVPFETAPSDWVDDASKSVVFRDSDGNTGPVFHEHYDENGEPAHPPKQPGYATAEIASDVPNDLPDGVTKHEEVTYNG